jgi:amidase
MKLKPLPRTPSLALVLCFSLLSSSSLLQAQERPDLMELRAKIQTGEQTPAALVEHYFKLSQQRNTSFQAVTVLRPEAKQEARTGTGLLQGLPLMVKDNIAVTGLATTAGSLALAENIATQDAPLVARLKQAGAVILGKTNLSEWANFRSTKSSSGWSSAGGQTRNAYDVKKSPCGSSSGSGAAVAAGMIPAAIGTETDGSITCPAAMNGLVGLKPTLGLVSRSGIVPLSHSQDTAGPMTLSVRDAALLMNVLAGSDASDSATVLADQKRARDYLQGLEKNALQGKRLGIVRQLSKNYDKATLTLFQEQVALLRAQGATVIENLTLPNADKLDADEFTVLLYEFKADLNAYLAQAPATVKTRTLSDLIAFNKLNAKQVMPYFSQELFEQAEKFGPLTEKKYQQALARVKKRAGVDGIDALMKRHQLDALIAPTTSAAWAIDYPKGDSFSGSASSPAAIAGYPHLTVPMGLVEGMPVGLSFFAGAWQDHALLKMGYAYEQARGKFPAPKLK